MPGETNKSLRLREGRLLGYAEAGVPNGTPVLYFHGTPGSRRELHTQTNIADDLGLRLFAIERPGYGLSDPQPGRRLLDWPFDVEEFADRLGLDDFAVIGFSGGGPYALACAHSLPQRVTCAALVSSPSPYAAMKSLPENLALFTLARDEPRQAAAVLNTLAGDGDRLYSLMTDSLPKMEKRVIAMPELATMYRQDMVASVLQGVDGLVQDMALIAGNWDFNLEDICRPVHLWHGLDDSLIPPAMGQYLENLLPNCRTMFLPEQGHFLLFTQWREILTKLVS